MEEGFPGEVTAAVRYSLLGEDALCVEYTASVRDRPTVLNVANHSYFNLTGDFSKAVLDHELYVHAERFTPVGANEIPTGELRSVQNTAVDFFSRPRRIGEKIDDPDDEIVRIGKGYDINFVLKDDAASSPEQ